jgi:hypothetical protein
MTLQKVVSFGYCISELLLVPLNALIEFLTDQVQHTYQQLSNSPLTTMAVIPGPHGSGEPSSSSSPGANTPRLRHTSIIAIIKSDESGNSSSLNHQPLLAASLKKQTSNKLLSKLFTTLSPKGARPQPTDLLATKLQVTSDDMDHPDLADSINPAPFIRPLENKEKMQARTEPFFRRYAGPLFNPTPRQPVREQPASEQPILERLVSEQSVSEQPVPDAIPEDQSQLSHSSEDHIARQREKAEQRLNGEEVEFSVISELDPALRRRYLGGAMDVEATNGEAINAGPVDDGLIDDDGPYRTYEERIEDEISKFVEEQHENIAASSAADESTVQRWRYYIECYTKARTPLWWQAW